MSALINFTDPIIDSFLKRNFSFFSMKKKTILISIFILSIMGVLFAVYLTFTKMILGVCPLTEPCSYFFGQPSCLYGFVLYLILLIISGILVFGKPAKELSLIKTLFWISLIGIIFAITSTIKEAFLTPCPGGKCVYSLGLPTCVYGLVMYIIILFLSLKLKKLKA